MAADDGIVSLLAPDRTVDTSSREELDDAA